MVGLSGLARAACRDTRRIAAGQSRPHRHPPSDMRGRGLKSICRKDMGIYRKEKSTLACALVGLSGLEPPTPTLSGWCSNLLSYNPISTINLAEPQPATVSVSHLPCVARWCSKPCELQSYIYRTNLARTIYPYISTGCVRSPRIFCIFHGLRKSAKPLLPVGIRHWWR